MKFALPNKLLLLVAISFFLLGCEERYDSKIYNTSLHVKKNDKIVFTCKDSSHTQTVQNALSNRTTKSEWKLLCFDSGLHGCTNPLSTNKTHNEGYIRLSLFYKNDEVYRIQYNYEDKKDKKVLKKMLKQMLEEVGE